MSGRTKRCPAAARARKKAKAPARRAARPEKPARTPAAARTLRDDPLARVRKICLALPEATEKTSWGAPTFRVRDKIFAMFTEDHHGDGRIALWCNASAGAQELLVGADPKRFFVPPYVGPRGWIGIRLDSGLPWGAVSDLVHEAYRVTAPKRLRESLEER